MAPSCSASNRVPVGLSGELSASMRAPRTSGRKHLGRRLEVRARVALHHHRLGAHHLAVVVVVPRRNAEHDAIAGIDERAIDGVDRRPSAGAHEERLDRIVEAEATLVELADRGRSESSPIGGG